MGFVKTADEVARIQATLQGVEFVGAEMLSVTFRTDPAVAAHVLPPGLEPAAESLVTATVGRWRSNCVGDFAGGALYVAARHGDVEADYVLTMFMDSDVPLIFGRELYGEPKKLATTGLFRQGSHAHAFVERGGTRLIELDVELGPDSGPLHSTGRTFNVKAMLAADGSGLASDPVLTLAEFDNAVTVRRPGTGRVALNGTVHDPLDEVPVLDVVGAGYVEADMVASCRELATIEADDFLPYAYGRMDDWSQLASGAPAQRAA